VRNSDLPVTTNFAKKKSSGSAGTASAAEADAVECGDPSPTPARPWRSGRWRSGWAGRRARGGVRGGRRRVAMVGGRGNSFGPVDGLGVPVDGLRGHIDGFFLFYFINRGGHQISMENRCNIPKIYQDKSLAKNHFQNIFRR